MSTTEMDAVEAAEPTAEDVRQTNVKNIVRTHALYAAASGLIPIPALDVATASTVQVRMIAQLCDEYNVAFSQHAIKSAVGSIVSSALPRATVGYSLMSAAKGVPVIGQVLGIATFPALNGAITWALGRAFAWHFNRGGTLEDMQADEMTDKFQQELEEGKAQVSGAASRRSTKKADDT